MGHENQPGQMQNYDRWPERYHSQQHSHKKRKGTHVPWKQYSICGRRCKEAHQACSPIFWSIEKYHLVKPWHLKVTLDQNIQISHPPNSNIWIWILDSQKIHRTKTGSLWDEVPPLHIRYLIKRLNEKWWYTQATWHDYNNYGCSDQTSAEMV